MKKHDKLPIVNKKYGFFDNGVVTQTRMDIVLVTDVIPFTEIDNCTLKLWKNETLLLDNLYAKKTDYFVKGNIISTNKELIFARTTDGSWFSFTDFDIDGQLDVDGKLTEKVNKKQII